MHVSTKFQRAEHSGETRRPSEVLDSICLHGRADLGLAPDEYAALTMVLLRLLAFKPQGAGASAEKKNSN